MTKQSRYSYTTSWAVGRRFRSHRREALTRRRCAGANLAIPARTWASADRRSAADWVLPGTSTSTWTERRPEGSFFTLIMAPWDWISAAEGAPRPPVSLEHRGKRNAIARSHFFRLYVIFTIGCSLPPLSTMNRLKFTVDEGYHKPPETLSSETPPGNEFNERIDAEPVTPLRRSGH